MIFFIIAIVILLAFAVRPACRSEVASVAVNDAFSRTSCNVIKGFFILWVIMRHSREYVPKDVACNSFDRLFYSVDSHAGQLIVVAFLFFSGYGVMKSYVDKGMKYVDTMPWNRILRLLVKFDVAVIIYALLGLMLGDKITLAKLGLSFVAWESVGNSTWYIFSITLCFCVSWIVLSFSSRLGRWLPLVHVSSILTLTSVISCIRPPWWSNTLWAYAFGSVIPFYPKYVTLVLRKLWMVFIPLAVCVVLAGDVYWYYWNWFQLRGNLMACMCCVLLLVVMWRYSFQSRFLAWCGSNLFVLYIYERIPMRILSTVWANQFEWKGVYFYLLSVLTTTLMIAVLFGKIDSIRQCCKAFFLRTFVREKRL